MQILLACAKTMHDNVKADVSLTTPMFQHQADSFARDMMQYDVDTIADMLGCSRQIAVQNKLRFMCFFDEDKPKLPAILAYYGQAYKHLKAETMSGDDLLFANSHLWITSFLYGLLRPLDGIRPYRMEGKVTLPSADGKNLFNFWNQRTKQEQNRACSNYSLHVGGRAKVKPYLTDVLIESVKADDGILVHLATEEFQHLFDWKRVCEEVHVIQPLFYVRKGHDLKMQAVWAKTCRGAMTRYIIDHRLTSPGQLYGFRYEGFEYDPHIGEADFPHFIRM